jgi:hypothetical protein
MMLGCKNYGGLDYFSKYTVGTAWVVSKTIGQKENNEYCSPEIWALSEAVERINAKRRPICPLGKTNVSRKETVKCTSKAAGIGV